MEVIKHLCVNAFIAFLSLSSAVHADQLYKKDVFSISLPDGWVEMPRHIIDAYEKGMARLAPNAPRQHYDYGFQLGNERKWFKYPYILVQIQNTGRIPKSQLEKLEGYSVQKGLEKHKNDSSPVMEDIQTGKMYYDKTKKIIWLRIESNVVGVGTISGLSGLIPTEKGIIQVSGYSTKSDNSTYEPVFVASAMSITPRSGLIYKPRRSDSLPPAVSGNAWGAISEKNIVTAAIAGMLIALFAGFRIKKKNVIKRPTTHLENISIYRTELMGLSILWIMFYHSGIYIPEFFLPLKYIKAIGYAGVDIFFLLSGVSLTFSISKDNSLMNFYWKRMIRIIPTYWICLLVMLPLNYMENSVIDVHMFLLSLFGLDFLVLGKLETWFIPSIILCYTMFPALYSLALKHGYGRVLLAFSLIAIFASLMLVGSPVHRLLIFTTRIPVFIFGIYIGFLLINKQKSILNNLYLNSTILFLSIAILFFVLLKTNSSFRWHTGLWWYPTIIMAFPFTILTSVIFSKIKHTSILIKLLRSFGRYSLEIYLIHLFVFQLAIYLPLKRYELNFFRIPEYTFYIVLTFVLSKYLSRFIRKINWEHIRTYLFKQAAIMRGR